MNTRAHDAADLFRQALAACPLVAVLRGLTPDEAPSIGDALVGAGFTMIEVPLNSPEPFESIRLLSGRYRPEVVIGAGTVLTAAEVARAADAGGRLIFSPNTDPEVIRATIDARCISLPGFFTPSEAFTALAAGAHGLKLFPAEGVSPAYLKAQRAVLPKGTPVLAVGGISPETMPHWRAAGADGFGLGSNLFKAGKAATDVAADAERFVSGIKDLT